MLIIPEMVPRDGSEDTLLYSVVIVVCQSLIYGRSLTESSKRTMHSMVLTLCNHAHLHCISEVRRIVNPPSIDEGLILWVASAV